MKKISGFIGSKSLVYPATGDWAATFRKLCVDSFRSSAPGGSKTEMQSSNVIQTEVRIDTDLKIHHD